MRREVGDLYRQLQGQLTDSDLIAWTGPERGSALLLRFLSGRAGIEEWIQFKAILTEKLLQKARQTLIEAGHSDMELIPNAFPPPWNLVSGMDYRRVAAHSNAISVKLYTMHWPMMLRFYADSIRRANPQVSDSPLVGALESWLDLVDDEGLSQLRRLSLPGDRRAVPGGTGGHVAQDPSGSGRGGPDTDPGPDTWLRTPGGLPEEAAGRASGGTLWFLGQSLLLSERR